MKQFITVICCMLTASGVVFAQNFEDYTVEIQDSVDYDFYEKTEGYSRTFESCRSDVFHSHLLKQKNHFLT